MFFPVSPHITYIVLVGRKTKFNSIQSYNDNNVYIYKNPFINSFASKGDFNNSVDPEQLAVEKAV